MQYMTRANGAWLIITHSLQDRRREARDPRPKAKGNTTYQPHVVSTASMCRASAAHDPCHLQSMTQRQPNKHSRAARPSKRHQGSKADSKGQQQHVSHMLCSTLASMWLWSHARDHPIYKAWPSITHHLQSQGVQGQQPEQNIMSLECSATQPQRQPLELVDCD